MLEVERQEFQKCTPIEKPLPWPEEEPFGPPFPEVPIQAEELDELQAIKEPIPKTVSPRVLKPTLVQEIKHKFYKNITVPVGAGAPGFTNQALGLRDLDIVADEMTIISFPVGKTGLQYRLNTQTNDATPILAVGQEEDQFEIDEIFLDDDGTGPAGNLVVRVIWNPYLIRLAP